MRNARAKQLRKLAWMYANPKSKGLLHEGKVTLYRGGDKEKYANAPENKRPWMIRIFQRRYAHDSIRKTYRNLKRMYNAGTLSVSTVHKTIQWFEKVFAKKTEVQNVTN